MASVYKQKKYKPIPDNAEIVRRRGQKVAKWTDGRGTRQEAPLSEDGSQIILENGPYWGKYRDHNGVVKRRSTGCRDKQSAEKRLQDWLTESDRLDSQLITTDELNAKQHAKRPTSEHTTVYIKALEHKTTRGKRTSPDHVANRRRQLERLVSDCGFGRLADITKGRMERWMHDREDEGIMSGRTINTFRDAALAFCRWCVSNDRLTSNPLEGLYRADETEKKRLRRALTEKEIAKLLEVTQRRPLVDALTITSGPNKGKMLAKIKPDRRERLIRLGQERALIFEVEIYTGLRLGELASVKVSDVHLGGQSPYVEIQASDAKDARRDQVAIPLHLAAKLKDWIANKLPTAKLFKVSKGLRKILYRDLALAGIQALDDKGRPIADDQGRRIDVHALRHTCGTELAKHGVLPQVASKQMRHSTINMTMKHYTHLAIEDKSKAVERLPVYDTGLGVESEKKTGTDDADVTPSEKYAQKYAQCQS